MRTTPTPFLRIPPFPGARAHALAVPAASPAELSNAEIDRLIERSRELKVGGTYWTSDAAAETLGASAPQARTIFREQVLTFNYVDPFSGKPMSTAEAIELCGFWRRLIDRNRDIDAAVGFAFWKRDTVAPLLWAARELRFTNSADEIEPGSTVAIWRARTSQRVIEALEAKSATLIEVEDGFIRSAGLGADCVPPLSIVVDTRGAHFNPGRASELEMLIQNGGFTEAQVARARALRLSIVHNGLSKYDAGAGAAPRRVSDRRHILVPGQVEDDRSVLEGGGEVRTNFELLKRVRAGAPDAYILYKPHPDVEAGHRIGRMSDSECLTYADEVVRDVPITALMTMADEVHVNTSLAGFEALLRAKAVTTYGVPFYAGWGLTRDMGPVPARRSARPTVDELVAAVLLEYPRYLDPVTGLPCPAEVVVERLIRGGTTSPNLIVGLRRVQGKIMRRLRSFVA